MVDACADAVKPRDISATIKQAHRPRRLSTAPRRPVPSNRSDVGSDTTGASGVKPLGKPASTYKATGPLPIRPLNKYVPHNENRVDDQRHLPRVKERNCPETVVCGSALVIDEPLMVGSYARARQERRRGPAS